MKIQALLSFIKALLGKSVLYTVNLLCAVVNRILDRMDRSEKKSKSEKIFSDIEETTKNGTLDDLLDLGNRSKGK